MHSPQVMQPICALGAIDAVAEPVGVLRCLLDASARLAAPVLVGHQQRFFVHHRRLDAWPGAHVDAHLFAHEAAQRDRSQCQHRDRYVGNRCRLAAPEILDQRGRIGEIHDPRATGPEPDEQVDAPLEGAARHLAPGPRCRVEPDARIAIAVDEAVDVLKQVRPHRLRTSIAAPCAPHGAGHEKQADPRHDQQPGHEVEFVRPDLDAEHVEAAIGEIYQHGLVGRVGAAVPADPRRYIVDPQGDQHHQPFEPAERPVDPLVVHSLARLVEPFGQVLSRGFVRFVATRRRRRIGNRTRDRLVALGDAVLDDYRPVAFTRWPVVFRVVHRPLPRDPRQLPRSLRLPRASVHRPPTSSASPDRAGPPTWASCPCAD